MSPLPLAHYAARNAGIQLCLLESIRAASGMSPSGPILYSEIEAPSGRHKPLGMYPAWIYFLVLIFSMRMTIVAPIEESAQSPPYRLARDGENALS